LGVSLTCGRYVPPTFWSVWWVLETRQSLAVSGVSPTCGRSRAGAEDQAKPGDTQYQISLTVQNAYQASLVVPPRRGKKPEDHWRGCPNAFLPSSYGITRGEGSWGGRNLSLILSNLVKYFTIGTNGGLPFVTNCVIVTLSQSNFRL